VRPPNARRILVCLVAGLVLSACHAQRVAAPPARVAEPAVVPPAAVRDAEFASVVHRLLRDGSRSAARESLLAGAIERALHHAGERFVAHQDERGMATLTGAIYLARSGELTPAMVAPSAEALRGAIAFVSQRGDGGRAVALLSFLRATFPADSVERKDVDEHLAALTTWVKETVRGDGVQTLGDTERASVSRALLEANKDTTAAARDSVVRWIERSLRFHEERTAGAPRPRREDMLEAFRAFRSGAQTLVSLYLRNGDGAGAYSELVTGAVRKITPPSLFDKVDAVGNGGDAAAWRDLLDWLWAPGHGDEDAETGAGDEPEFTIDPDLHKAALWGAAVEAYRRDATQLRLNLALSTLLLQLGLTEVAPLVLADGVVTSPDAVKVNASLRFVLQAIVHEDNAEDPASARRTYASAEPLLRLASRADLARKLDPSPARVQLVMGSIESHAAELSAARALYESSASVEPSADAFVALSAIERQQGKLDAALADLAKALDAPDARKSPLAAGEIRLAAFELRRQQGGLDGAREELSRALSLGLEARKISGRPPLRSRAERLVAHALDRFSDRAGSARAFERAFAAAGEDRRELTTTVLDAASSALVLGDVSGAARAVDRALTAGLADEDLVYVALWAGLVDKSASAQGALAGVRDDGRWVGRLASWGLGRIRDQDLVASARTASQRTEATFYVAMARRAAGDVDAATRGLREVAGSAAIELMEVRIARDLLAGPARNLAGPPPLPAP
jgi:tetratricopeptide (TPR) repeat protein